jgi:hypothetical protein
MKKKITLGILCVLLAAQSGFAAEIPAKGVGIHQDAKTQLTLVVGEITLPDESGEIETPPSGSPVAQVFFLIEDDSQEEPDDRARRKKTAFLKKPSKKCQFAALLRDKNAAEAVLTLRVGKKADGSVARETIRWNLAEAKANPLQDAKEWKQWKNSRQEAWAFLASPATPNPLADYWHILDNEENTSERRPENRAPFNSLSLFGGQVAIRETLQTQLLENSGASGASGAIESVDIKKIEGVTVRAHPYEEMRAALPPQKTPPPKLADYVPPDRLFVLLREPKKVSALLSGADETADRLTPLLGGAFADYALLARYTAKFGLTPEQFRQWFSGGHVAEAALFTPDVFFLDNTDLTIILRLKPGAPTPFQLAKKIPGILSLPVSGGGSFHLASRDDFLFLSSNKSELEKSLELAKNNGDGSLARLSEFHVMTHALPPADKNAGVYVYFSDPFLRRLTGPEVKIGQQRRAAARARMELIATAALAYRLDHGADAPDLATLAQRGYLGGAKEKILAPTSGREPAFFFEKGTVRSKEWGTLANLRTLAENPARAATPTEAKAYNTYRENYTQFWRDFFDPIAVRLDLKQNGDFALETFILPLLQNSIYDTVKNFLGEKTAGVKQLPIYRETPVASTAFVLPEKTAGAFQEAAPVWMPFLAPLLPKLGNVFTFSVQDSEAIIQANYSALSPLSGLSGETSWSMRNNELSLVGLVSSVLTRPCDIAISVNDEAAARRALRSIPNLNFAPYTPSFKVETLFDEAEERVVLVFKEERIALKMEISLSIENGWLHISNHPWTSVPIIGTTASDAGHIHIGYNPAGLKQGLPQALSLANSAYRQTIFATAASLFPWMTAHGVDAQEALKLQRAAFGRGTPMPPGVNMDTTERPQINTMGTWLRPRITNAKTDTGALRDISNLRLWMRFEDGGLRSRVEFSPLTSASGKDIFPSSTK